MQKVTVQDVKTKSGTSAKGPWTLVIVTSEDGAEFTSFDKGLAKLRQSAVIEIEPEVTTKDGKTTIKIKEWKLISEGTGEQRAGSGGGYKNADIIQLEEEGRRYRQNIDRVSIEGQVAFKEVAEMIRAGTKEATKDLLDLWVKVAKAKLTTFLGIETPRQVGAVTKPFPKVPPDSAPKVELEPKKGKETPKFKNGADLANYALKHGMTLAQFRDKTGVENPNDIADVDAAYRDLKEFFHEA